MFCKMLLASFISILVIQFVFALDVGDECKPSDDVVVGTCKVITDCDVAIRWIKNKKFNLIQRCGFSGDLEVVCCPKSNKASSGEPNSSNSRFVERIADRECQKIIQESIPPRNLNIIDGELASLGEFSHMVALGYDRDSGLEFECGGSLISTSYILTAAHCVDTLDRIEPTVARMGLVELGDKNWNDEYDYRIAEIIQHPEYTRREKYHDLALIRLEKPAKLHSNLNAACLFTSTVDPKYPLTITGWGTTNVTTSAKSNFLLKASVSVISREKCSQSYTNWRKLPNGVTDEQICAGDPTGQHDTCQGDSGGPLQAQSSPSDIQYRIVGITSFGRGCGSGVPGVYTRVVHYLDWIESIVWPN